jgi:hypothetical protein
MTFIKGDTKINRAGRPKGSTSYSAKLRQQITEYCEENLLYFLNEIKAMKSGHAKSQAFLTLLNYALPKLTESNSVIDVDKLSTDEVDKIFNRLIDEAA